MNYLAVYFPRGFNDTEAIRIQMNELENDETAVIAVMTREVSEVTQEILNVHDLSEQFVRRVKEVLAELNPDQIDKDEVRKYPRSIQQLFFNTGVKFNKPKKFKI